jgi:hypothetical protein
MLIHNYIIPYVILLRVGTFFYVQHVKYNYWIIGRRNIYKIYCMLISLAYLMGGYKPKFNIHLLNLHSTVKIDVVPAGTIKYCIT